MGHDPKPNPDDALPADEAAELPPYPVIGLVNVVKRQAEDPE